MDTRKKLILIIVTGTIVIGVIISVIALISRPQNNGSYIETAAPFVRDQDTGEVVVYDPSTVEPGEQREVIVLGLEILYGFGLLESQVITVRNGITRFAEERLEGEYETVTVRPQDVLVEGGVFSSTLRLGESETLLPITITYNDTGLVRVIIGDPSNSVGGTFDGGEVIIRAD